MKKSLPKSWETKTSIFKNAMALLDRMDIEAITVRMIAKEANISVGTFYIYYETKMDVYYDAYYIMDQYFETTVVKNMPQGDIREKLQYYFEQYHIYNTERTSFRLFSLLTLYCNKLSLKNYGYGMQHVLKQLIEDAQASGQITKEESAEEITLFMLTCMRGCYRHWVLTNGAVDIDKMSRDFTKKIIDIYVKKSE